MARDQRIVRRMLAAWIHVGAVMASGAYAAPHAYLLIDRGLNVKPIELLGAGERGLRVPGDGGAGGRLVPIADCVALVRAAGERTPEREAAVAVATAFGVLTLSDGQRLPGMLTGAPPPDEETIDWVHPHFGLMPVPIDRVAGAALHASARIPAPGEEDVVELINGDRLEGFIEAVGDPIAISREGSDGSISRTEIPLDRASGLAIVAGRKSPTGRRIWFDDGTILDAAGLEISEDGYARFRLAWVPEDTATGFEARLATVSAVLFDPGALVPLASLAPARVDRTTPRYVVPPPRVDDPDAPLGLGRVHLRGPLRVHYALPTGCSRFSTSAALLDSARDWGDLDLIIKDDDREIFRARLNAASPSVAINVPLTGSELIIELGQGENGPVQDHVVLERAMLLVE